MNAQTNQMSSECCGCGTQVLDTEDFGNNADVSETCCKACFEAELSRREREGDTMNVQTTLPPPEPETNIKIMTLTDAELKALIGDDVFDFLSSVGVLAVEEMARIMRVADMTIE